MYSYLSSEKIQGRVKRNAGGIYIVLHASTRVNALPQKSVALRQQNASFEVRRNGVAANFDHISDIVEVLLKMILRCGFLSLFPYFVPDRVESFLSSSSLQKYVSPVRVRSCYYTDFFRSGEH